MLPDDDWSADVVTCRTPRDVTSRHGERRQKWRRRIGRFTTALGDLEVRVTRDPEVEGHAQLIVMHDMHNNNTTTLRSADEVDWPFPLPDKPPPSVVPLPWGH